MLQDKRRSSDISGAYRGELTDYHATPLCLPRDISKATNINAKEKRHVAKVSIEFLCHDPVHGDTLLDNYYWLRDDTRFAAGSP